MSPARFLQTGFILLVVFGSLTCATELRVSNSVCPAKSTTASILGLRDSVCPWNAVQYFIGVIEGDETSMQKALSMVDTNGQDYVVVLLYASWCPFSTSLKPSLSVMSSLYPSIPHFAIEESVIKPRLLLKYGVNGFPTLFVVNSTMRVRYHGSRTLTSLVAFYTDVTGVKAEWVNKTSEDKMETESYVHETFRRERFVENIVGQETYLALATLFVVLRSLYLIHPFIMTYGERREWVVRRLWEQPLNPAIQLFSSLAGCMGIGKKH